MYLMLIYLHVHGEVSKSTATFYSIIIIGNPTYPTYLFLSDMFPKTPTPLQKHAYSNVLKILPPKNENLLMKNSDIFRISAQNIDCGYSLELPRRGGSNEYPQSMFLSTNKKNNVYPCKP